MGGGDGCTTCNAHVECAGFTTRYHETMTSPKRFRVWDGEEMYYPPHAYLLTSEGGVVREKLHRTQHFPDAQPLFSTDLTDKCNINWGKEVE